MTNLINRAGNDNDVLNSLKVNFKLYSVELIECSIEDEKANRNRSTHIKHLERALKYKQKGQDYFGRSKKL
jgi:hypothetical protein